MASLAAAMATLLPPISISCSPTATTCASLAAFCRMQQSRCSDNSIGSEWQYRTTKTQIVT